MMLLNVLAAVVARPAGSKLWLGVGFACGVLFCVLGVMTVRLRAWSVWTSAIIAAVLLAGELWSAYGGGRRPEGATVSVFVLTVPAIVLIMNMLAVGAARRLPSRGQRHPPA
jgi:hypothetical protein